MRFGSARRWKGHWFRGQALLSSCQRARLVFHGAAAAARAGNIPRAFNEKPLYGRDAVVQQLVNVNRPPFGPSSRFRPLSPQLKLDRGRATVKDCPQMRFDLLGVLPLFPLPYSGDTHGPICSAARLRHLCGCLRPPTEGRAVSGIK